MLRRAICCIACLQLLALSYDSIVLTAELLRLVSSLFVTDFSHAFCIVREKEEKEIERGIAQQSTGEKHRHRRKLKEQYKKSKLNWINNTRNWRKRTRKPNRKNKQRKSTLLFLLRGKKQDSCLEKDGWTFGSVKQTNSRSIQDRVWMDLDINSFMCVSLLCYQFLNLFIFFSILESSPTHTPIFSSCFSFLFLCFLLFSRCLLYLFFLYFSFCAGIVHCIKKKYVFLISLKPQEDDAYIEEYQEVDMLWNA